MNNEFEDGWMDLTVDIDIIDPELERSREYRIARFLKANHKSDAFKNFYHKFRVISANSLNTKTFYNIVEHCIINGNKTITRVEYLSVYGGVFNHIRNVFSKLTALKMIKHEQVPGEKKSIGRKKLQYYPDTDMMEKYYFVFHIMFKDDDI